MERREFLVKTIKEAEAGLTLGYDVVERFYERHNDHLKARLVLKGVRHTAELPTKLFSDVAMGECISLAYIANSDDIKKTE